METTVTAYFLMFYMAIATVGFCLLFLLVDVSIGAVVKACSSSKGKVFDLRG